MFKQYCHRFFYNLYFLNSFLDCNWNNKNIYKNNFSLKNSTAKNILLAVIIPDLDKN